MRLTRLSDNIDARWNLFAPPAPTNLVATAGNAQASLTWTAPTVLAQTPITDYVVDYKESSASTWTTFSDGTSTATSATVTGLTNGTAYVFRVAGVNGVGVGTYTSASVTPGVDAYFSNVSLLLHMDGSGNTFADSSSLNHATVAIGSVTQSAAQSKFGGKAAYFDGNGDKLSATAGDEFAYGTGDFTVEGWFYSDGWSYNWGWGDTYGYLFTQAQSGHNYFLIDAGSPADRRLGFTWAESGGGTTMYGPAWPLLTWNHFAVVRLSGAVTIYINGTGGTPSSVTQNFTNTTYAPTLGGYAHTNIYSFGGYIDEFRITKGVARYTTNFTPSVAAFPDA